VLTAVFLERARLFTKPNGPTQVFFSAPILGHLKKALESPSARGNLFAEKFRFGVPFPCGLDDNPNPTVPLTPPVSKLIAQHEAFRYRCLSRANRCPVNLVVRALGFLGTPASHKQQKDEN
jgi:hypothetical protein